jgi:hypothetical protein
MTASIIQNNAKEKVNTFWKIILYFSILLHCTARRRQLNLKTFWKRYDEEDSDVNIVCDSLKLCNWTYNLFPMLGYTLNCA